MNEIELKNAVEAMGNKVQGLVEEWRKSDAEQKSALEARIKGLEDQHKILQEQAKATERLHLPGVEVGKGEKGKFAFTRLAKVLGGMVKTTDSEVGYEVEVCNEMQRRFDSFPVEMKTAINAASGSGGAFLIPMEVYSDILPELEAQSILSRLGLRSFSGLSGNVAWNRDLGGITAEYVDSEAEATTNEYAPTFGHMELKPHVYAAFVPLTFGMLTQPAQSIEPWVRSRMAYKIGLLRDKYGFIGTGNSGQPTGIQYAGCQTIDWTASPVTTDVSTATELVAVVTSTIGKVYEANAALPGAKFGWAMGTFSASHLSRGVDGSGRPLMWPSLTSTIATGNARITMLGNYPVAESSQLNVTTTAQTTEALYFGDWNQGAEFNWGTLAFASSDSTETNFRKLRVTIRAVGAHDFGWFQPSAFVRCTGHNAQRAWTLS